MSSLRPPQDVHAHLTQFSIRDTNMHKKAFYNIIQMKEIWWNIGPSNSNSGKSICCKFYCLAFKLLAFTGCVSSPSALYMYRPTDIQSSTRKYAAVSTTPRIRTSHTRALESSCPLNMFFAPKSYIHHFNSNNSTICLKVKRPSSVHLEKLTNPYTWGPRGPQWYFKLYHTCPWRRCLRNYFYSAAA